MFKANIFLILLLSLFITSCDLTDDPEITGTPVQSMAGEWYLQLSDATTGAVYIDYSLATTANTAANTSDKMWFSDEGHFWGTQNLMDVNVSNQTFSGDYPNILFSIPANPSGKPVVSLGTEKELKSALPDRIKITDGKILENAAHVPSKTEADSFYCQMTGFYRFYTFVADRYNIVIVDSTTLKMDTTVIWRLATSDKTEEDGPYGISGYRRTGFLEDEH